MQAYGETGANSPRSVKATCACFDGPWVCFFFRSSTCQLYRNDGIHRHQPPDVPPMVAGSPVTYHNLLVPSVTLSWVPPNKENNKKMNRTKLLVGVYYRSEPVDSVVDGATTAPIVHYYLMMPDISHTVTSLSINKFQNTFCCSGALHVNPLQQKEPMLAEAMFLVVFSHDLQSCKLPALATFQASTLESLEHVYFVVSVCSPSLQQAAQIISTQVQTSFRWCNCWHGLGIIGSHEPWNSYELTQWNKMCVVKSGWILLKI